MMPPRAFKTLRISIPRAMYERFRGERYGYGARTVRQVIEAKLRFWEGKQEDTRVS